MNLDEFEAQFRDGVDITLNQLQTVTLLLSQLQIQHSAAGESLQNLTLLVETFITQQREGSN
jgi:hypothetical protein